jgi:DNA-binding MarR family transcriptional regulator
LAIFERAALDPAAAPNWLKVQPDGWQHFGQGDAAAATGVSKPTVGRRIKKLESSGAIASRVTNQGTAIKLLYPLKSVA